MESLLPKMTSLCCLMKMMKMTSHCVHYDQNDQVNNFLKSQRLVIIGHFHYLKLRETRGFKQKVAFLPSLSWPLIVKQRLVIFAFI